MTSTTIPNVLLILVVRLAIPIAIQMEVVEDSTTSVAPLLTFSGLPKANPDQYLPQFLAICIANNRRMEDVWLKGYIAYIETKHNF